MSETAMTPRDRLRAHVMESVSKSGSGAVLVSTGEVAALFDEVDQLDFALDMLNGLYEDRTAYMIIHKGMGLACSSALREAYSDMSVRAEQAEATITQLRAELERVKGRCEALAKEFGALAVVNGRRDVREAYLNCTAAVRSVVDGAGGE